MTHLAMTPEEIRADWDRFLMVGAVVVVVLLVLTLIGGIWAFLRAADWWGRHQAESFWAGRQRDQQLRQQELDDYGAAGELPVRVMRQYLTAEEMAWDQEEMEARGYELAHQPFTNADGLIVVTYRLARETHTA
jgi:hypothetical protein